MNLKKDNCKDLFLVVNILIISTTLLLKRTWSLQCTQQENKLQEVTDI